jgi:hypothetical protein
MPAAIVEPLSAEAGTAEAAMLPLRITAAKPPAMIFFENAFIQLLLSKARLFESQLDNMTTAQ